ncbi:MAG: 4-hydroxy-tetrahydrodipicolinate synthase [Sedimenticola sp.]
MFQGSYVALVTPMSEDGSLDEESLRALIDWHVEQGTDGIVAVGTTGESATLGEKEHCYAIRRMVELTAGRLPVMAGTGANSTTEAINLTRCAKEAGADGALLVTPYYNKPMQEGLYLHYKAVAEAVDLPQMLYNVPSRTACDMLPDTIGRLSAIPNIIGVKEATGDLHRVALIRELCGGEFDIFSGDDATSRELVLAGGQGTISVTANIAPAAVSQMIVAALAGDNRRAEEIDSKIAGLHRDLFLESSPIPVKWALWEMGRIPQGIRLPLTWFAEEHRNTLRNTMLQAGIL